MQLILNESRKEWSNWEPAAIWQEIEEILTSQGLLLNNLIVDGQEIYDDFQDYLSQHHDSIQMIEVIAITLTQYMKWSLKHQAENLVALKENAHQLSNQLYGCEIAFQWHDLGEFIQSAVTCISELDNNISVFEEVGLAPELCQNLSGHNCRLKESIRMLERPLQEKDVIYLADILHFEAEKAISQLAELCDAVSDQIGD